MTIILSFSDTASRGSKNFSQLPVVAGVACLDCSGDVNLEKNVLPEDPLGARCDLLTCSSPFTYLQSWYDTG
jgi:hypothetical protein